MTQDRKAPRESTYQHALRIWFQEQGSAGPSSRLLPHHWYRTNPHLFAHLVARAEAAGFQARAGRVKRKAALRRLLAEEDEPPGR
jgi:hypothetical protein